MTESEIEINPVLISSRLFTTGYNGVPTVRREIELPLPCDFSGCSRESIRETLLKSINYVKFAEQNNLSVEDTLDAIEKNNREVQRRKDKELAKRNDPTFRDRHNFCVTDTDWVIEYFRNNPSELTEAYKKNRLFECLVAKTWFTGDYKNNNIFQGDQKQNYWYVLMNSQPTYRSKLLIASMWTFVRKIITSPEINNILCGLDCNDYDNELDSVYNSSRFESYFTKVSKAIIASKGEYDDEFDNAFPIMLAKIGIDKAKSQGKEAKAKARKYLEEAQAYINSAFKAIEVAEEDTDAAEEALVEAELCVEPTLVQKRKHLTQAFKVILAHSQGYRCKMCDDILAPGWHTDHAKPLWDGGTDTEDNLQALCQLCHLRKTSHEAQRRAGKVVDDIYPIEVTKKQDDVFQLLDERLSKIEKQFSGFCTTK